MSEIQESLHLEDGIFAHSLSDYRLKVEDIIRAENERFSKLAEDQAKAIINCALKKAQEITVESERKAARIAEDTQQQAQKISNEIQQKANQKYTEIIDGAQQQAQQIILKAEEEAKTEARNRVKSQEEKLLLKMKEESHSILAAARKNAEKERDDIIEKAKKEVKQNIEEEVAKVKAEAQAKSDKISAEAEQKAVQMINALVSSSNEVNDMIIKAIKKSETILEKMKSDMNTEVGELTKTMVIARSKLQQAAAPAPEIKSKEDTALQKGNKDTGKNNVDIWVALEGERTAQRDDGTFLFKGQMEIKSLASASAKTYAVIKNLKDIFNRAPNVSYGGESYSEKEFSRKYEIKEPLPIVDILNNIPLVREVVVRDDNLGLVLK
jgi:F0F1-type ATP synthase membrane subunit b/b'